VVSKPPNIWVVCKHANGEWATLACIDTSCDMGTFTLETYYSSFIARQLYTQKCLKYMKSHDYIGAPLAQETIATRRCDSTQGSTYCCIGLSHIFNARTISLKQSHVSTIFGYGILQWHLANAIISLAKTPDNFRPR